MTPLLSGMKRPALFRRAGRCLNYDDEVCLPQIIVIMLFLLLNNGIGDVGHALVRAGAFLGGLNEDVHSGGSCRYCFLCYELVVLIDESLRDYSWCRVLWDIEAEGGAVARCVVEGCIVTTGSPKD